MNYVVPLESDLEVTDNDIIYKANYFQVPSLIENIVNESYSNYAAGTTYATFDYVIVPELKRIYRSSSDANVGNFPPANANASKWTDFGAINSYRAFETDINIGNVTTATDPIYEFDFSRQDSIGGVDLNFISAQMMQIDTANTNYLSTFNISFSYSINDSVVYNKKLYNSTSNTNVGSLPDSLVNWVENDDDVYFNEEILGRDIGCYTFAEYFFDELTQKSRVIFTDFEWLANSVLRIEIYGACTIGSMVIGKKKELGATLVGSRLSLESNSTIITDEITGFRTVQRYGKIRVLTASVVFDTAEFNTKANKIDGLIDKTVLWLPSSNDKFSEAISLGYIETMEIPMESISDTITTTKIIGVHK